MKVFFNGGDGFGWALDEDLRLTIDAAKSLITPVKTPEEADIIHSIWWESLKNLSTNKPVLCHLTGSLFRYLTLPEFSFYATGISQWITRSSEALEDLKSIKLEPLWLPYIVDTNIFKPEDKLSIRKKLGISENAYIIGNFHRDTEGRDLVSPKLEKGPDIFLEIVDNLRKMPIHVLLAGPRRHWLRNKLTERNIPFTYIGNHIKSDDLTINLLNRNDLNTLYNALDLYVISSRNEGGPHSALEASSAKCKIISTNVGHINDILNKKCIYRSIDEAINIIAADIKNQTLNDTLDEHEEKIKTNHTIQATKPALEKIYNSVQFISSKKKTFSKIKVQKISIWHNFVKPPWGGGNQFLLALSKEIKRKGIDILENAISDDIDAYLLNSVHFNINAFRKQKTHKKIVHRIDGPIALARGTEDAKQLDQLSYDLNGEFASSTVLQSTWTLQQIAKNGYIPVNPVIIRNAVDPSIFYRPQSHSLGKKIKLISSSWSNNPRKGGAIHKWIEDNLDWTKYEYTFVGNTSLPLNKTKTISAIPSERLADILREHDIYIMCSESESCSNALIEALACGLPSIYNTKAANHEIVGYSGLGFSDVNEIFPCIERIVNSYENFRNLITIPNISDVADKYLALLSMK